MRILWSHRVIGGPVGDGEVGAAGDVLLPDS